MRSRRLLIVLLVLLLPTAEESFSAPARTGAFWVGSDGHGTISLFWLPTGGRWPPGGFRLERVTRKKRVVLADAIRPGEDAGAMAALDPKDAEAIRRFGERVREGSLTEEERRDSIAVMGRTAAASPPYGRALGVRYTDKDVRGPKRTYRLTAFGADGEEIETMETDVVDPSRGSPEPRRPFNLRAEGGPDGVALYWADPPSREGIPVVAYQIDRMGPGGKTRVLTPSPVVLDRHLSRGKPDFVHAPSPREPAVYFVRSVDIFGRRSEPASVEVSLDDFYPASEGGSVAAQVSDWLATQGIVEGGTGDSIRETEVRTAPAAPPVKETPGSSAGSGAGAGPAFANAKAPTAGKTKAPPASPLPKRSASAGIPALPSAQSAPAPPAPPEPEKTFPGAAEFRVVYAPSPVVRDDPPPSADSVETPDAPAAPKQEPPPPPKTFPGGVEFRARYEPSDAVLLPAEKPPPAPPAASPPAQPPPPPAGAVIASRRTTAADAGLGPPSITGIASIDGRVTITFRPAPPESRTVAVHVLRSTSAGSPGVSVGRPADADAGRWEDGSAEPGQSYWYRLVAVDRQGNRSAPSPARFVRVVPRAADVDRRAPEFPGAGIDGP